MGFGFRKFLQGIRLVPVASNTTSVAGDLQTTADGRLNYNDGTASSPIVTESSTDTLTNKTLTNPVINGGTYSPTTLTVTDAGFSIENSSDATKVIDFNIGSATTGTTLNLVANQTATRTIAFPNADGTLAGISATQTLTNKTISGSANTITNIDLTSAVTGLLPKANGGSAQDNSSITFPASGTLVTETGTETLTNKTLTTPIIDVESFTQQSGTPSTPSSGTSKVYIKTNNTPYILGPNGIETPIGTGGSGGSKNYLTNYTASKGQGVANPGNGNFENGSTSGWSLFHTTLTGVIPTGSIVSGATSITEFTVKNSQSSVVLQGNYSLITGAQAPSTQYVAGDGFITDPFFIDNEDISKTLNFQFSYSAESGTYNFSGTSSNTFAVYIYDVINSAWIQPQGVYNLIQGSGVGSCTGSFEATNSSQYRLAIVVINSNGTQGEILWDDFSIGPSIPTTSTPLLAYFNGHMDSLSVSTASQTFNDGTPSGTNTLITRQTSGISVSAAASSGIMGITWTPTTTNAVYLVTASVFCRLTGASNASGTIQLTDGTNVIGFAQIQSVNAGDWNTITSIYAPATSSPLTLKLQFRCASGDNIQTLLGDVGSAVEWTITQLNNTNGNSGSTAPIVAKANTSTQTVGTSFSPVICTNKEYDTTGAYNASTGIFTVPVSGFYKVSSTATLGSPQSSAVNEGVVLAVRKNSTVISWLTAFYFPVTTTNLGPAISGTTTIQCNAGDTLDVSIVRDTQVSNFSLLSTNTAQTWIAFELLNGGTSLGTVTPQEISSLIITDTSLAAPPTLNTYYDASGLSISLTPGIWDLFAIVVPQLGGDNGQSILVSSIRDGNNNEIQGTLSGVINTGSTSDIYGSHTITKRVTIGSTTTYKISCKFIAQTGTPTATNLDIRGDLCPGGCYISGRRVSF